MAFAFFDRVKETSASTGTGNITLAGAVSGFRTFASVYSNNDTFEYCITDQNGTAWEVGIGTFVSATPAIARTTVKASSNAGAAVNFTSGALYVFVTLPAYLFNGLTSAGSIVGTDAAQTLTNKSIATSQLTGALPAANAPANTGDVLSTAGALAQSVVAVGGHQIGGRRNALINGAFDVWQRGTTFTPVASTATMVADMWAAKRNTSANWTLTKQTSGAPAGFLNYCRLQRNVGTTDVQQIGIANMVETIDAARWANIPVVLSYYARCGADFSPTLQKITSRVVTGTGTNENVWSTYTGSSNDISVAQALTTSWVRYSHAGTLQSALTELAAQFLITPAGTAGAADYLDITGVMIEPATAVGFVTPFEFMPFADTFALCRRFCQKTFPYATAPAQNAGVTGALSTKNPIAAGDPAIDIQFSPPMFPGTINFTTYNPSNTNANWRNITAGADATVSVDPGNTKSETGLLVGTSGTVANLGDILAIHYLASSTIGNIQ
jgi:hypothetical protein